MLEIACETCWTSRKLSSWRRTSRRKRGTGNSSEKVLLSRNFTRIELATHAFGTPDEADIFDSDFGSTDEGSAPEDDLVGEKRLEREAKAERRVSTPHRYRLYG